MPSPSLKRSVRELAAPVGDGLARIGITANAVTLFGLVLAAGCGVLLGRGRWLSGFLCLLASGLCDLIDGAVARARGGTGSPLGAALDSAVDRYGEAMILTGVLVDAVHRRQPGEGFLWLWSLALTAAFLTSYVRARAEGLGFRCEVGLLERPERLTLLGLLCLVGPRGAGWILGALAVGGHITVVQRILHVRREMQTGRARGGGRP
jgi:CDP-diacylglycerol---glycerol-3-phosphate 3-phosphatidyltransferase